MTPEAVLILEAAGLYLLGFAFERYGRRRRARLKREAKR